MNLVFELAYLEGLKNKFDALLPPFICNQRGCEENASYSNNVLTSARVSENTGESSSRTVTTRKLELRNGLMKEDVSM